MERRSSLRKPIHHDAMLRLPNGATWPCIIADYCAEGMLLKYSLSASSAVEACAATTNNMEVAVLFKGDSGQDCSVLANPVHRMKGAAGLRFVGAHPKAVEALLIIAGEETGCKIAEEEMRHIIHECIDAIQQFTAPHMETLYPKLVSEIKDAAVHASSDQNANAMMESANMFGRESQRIQQNFLAAIQDPLSELNQGLNEGDGAVDKLSVIDKGEFEDWLTTRVIITKAETSYREHLLPLKMRLDAAGLADKKHHQSPFGPALLVNAFQSGVSRLQLSNAVERIVYKGFEMSVMEHLEPLYEELNQILINHNLLPELDLKRNIKKEPERAKTQTKEPEQNVPERQAPQTSDANPAGAQEHAAPVGGSAPSGTGTRSPESPAGGQAVEPDAEHTPSIIDAIQPSPFNYGGGQNAESDVSPSEQSVTVSTPPFERESSDTSGKAVASPNAAYQNVLGLVKSLHDQQVAAEGRADAGAEAQEDLPDFSQDEISQSLSSLQRASVDAVTALDARISLLERLLGSLSPDGVATKNIPEDQQVAIDVVDRFFNSLNVNPRLTEEAKGQLHKLEIPVLKVLLQDEGFFDDAGSSVRAVMNRIAQLGAKGARLNPVSQKKVENLVEQIVQEFEQDTQVFDDALGELDDLVDRQNTLYRKNVDRVAAAAEGVHRVEQAKIHVARVLNQRLGKRAVPKAIATLVEKGWRDLLNLTHIKHGAESDEWTSYLHVLDDLLAYSEDPSQPLNLQVLLPKIQSGLKLVSGGNEAAPEIRDQLKEFFETAPAGECERIEPVLHEVPESELDLAQRNLKKSSELKPWIIRAKSIQPGSWVQFHKAEEDVQFMRLVWVAKGYSKYVFVNHQGMKVVELGLFKFATYLKDNVVTPDPSYEVPMVNQGLDDMVKDVYDKLAYESSHDEASNLPNKNEFCRLVRAAMKSGNRTSECVMLYSRFTLDASADESGEHGHISPDLAVKIAGEILEIQAEESIAGRVSENDFVLFVVSNELDTIANQFRTRLEAITHSDVSGSDRVSVALCESRAYLGFNNPESMLDHALSPIQQAEAKSASTDSDESAGGIPEEDSVVSIPAVNDAAAAEDFSEKAFEIYCQKSMMLSTDSIHEEQYEMICSEAGSGVSFEPENEAQARALDQWWVEQLVKKAAGIDPSWDSIDVLRVRLSGYAFQDDAFKEQLIDLAEQGLIESGKIWFDLYDCSVIENIHAAADMMKHLMVKGYRFCLDQFGTSSSPFALLKVFPVDLIKIDESFMSALNQEEADEGSADSIVEVAHYLGKEVLATSVESAICLQRMKQLGVDYVQGSTVSEYELLGPAV